MNKLYHKVYLGKGANVVKAYVCAVHGRHITRVFKIAQSAQDHSQALLRSLESLRAAEARAE